MTCRPPRHSPGDCAPPLILPGRQATSARRVRRTRGDGQERIGGWRESRECPRPFSPAAGCSSTAQRVCHSQTRRWSSEYRIRGLGQQRAAIAQAFDNLRRRWCSVAAIPSSARGVRKNPITPKTLEPSITVKNTQTGITGVQSNSAARVTRGNILRSYRASKSRRGADRRHLHRPAHIAPTAAQAVPH